ncbi:quinone oxidoreductase family protein [Falsirhodobacter sp. 20TX0035]|uniref:quinone oxidoreductase family protein n=1 Tax=Falsirhodobacter sp. 20TX0035 TaxID=3022019 RepID=UPI002330A158|nr:quinone oxidoreductase [Falsirhodobacter sp. 20TX0035]MDB6454924.1 quinone oxidoreductase [Falsirhodobacter sp. 20TX0035]
MAETITAIRFSDYGGPDVLSVVSAALPPPAAGEIQIRHLAIGVNFIDIYHRKGVFGAPLPLPNGLGIEGVGVVTAIGEGVTSFSQGQRVAYLGGPPGGYATHRNLPAARAIDVPDGLSDQTVAALLLKGLTVEYLIHRCAPVTAGETVVWHAAAGGVGLIACQWLHAIGVTVIGTVGSDAKAEIARAHGCDHTIVYTREDVAARVADITGGAKVRVVFDSVGADTFAASLECLRPRGTLVSFGESSGPVPPFGFGTLGARGSLFLTRPSIAHYTADRREYEAAANCLFAAIACGAIAAPQITTYPLVEAARAHADIQARRTSGSVILLP